MSATIRVVSCVAHAASVIPITLTQLNFASKNQAGERVTTNEGQAPRAVLDVHLIMSRLSIGDHPESELLFIHRNASVFTIHKARNNNFITLGWFCYACDAYKNIVVVLFRRRPKFRSFRDAYCNRSLCVFVRHIIVVVVRQSKSSKRI